MTQDPVIAEVRRIEEDALYTSQSNFIQATFYDGLNYWIGIPATLAAAAATASLVTDWSIVAAGSFAAVAALLAALQTFVMPERRASEFTTQGVAYRQLQTDARIYRTVYHYGLRESERNARLGELNRRRAELNSRNRPNERAFKKAQAKIGMGDLNHTVDSETLR